jgi:hypothetical protein
MFCPLLVDDEVEALEEAKGAWKAATGSKKANDDSREVR